MGHSMPTRPGPVRFSAAATLAQVGQGGRLGWNACMHAPGAACAHSKCYTKPQR